ncbi:glycosyltransferase family 4 protein [Azospirillum sp. sgz301742]
MKIVFIHQNMPGQFKHLAFKLAQNPDNKVVFITKRKDRDIPNVRKMCYELTRNPAQQTHNYLHRAEQSVLYGQAAARSLMELRQENFIPDIIVAHPGWGESLFAKDIFPGVPLINYCEFYYIARGADMDFDPSSPPSLDSILRSRVRCAHLLLSLEACDLGLSPTQWQRSVHPAVYHPKISVVHDGVDTTTVQPNPNVTLELSDGRVLTRKDKVVTYIARNLEPYRGFVPFMRSLPLICEAHPDATVLIVGGDEISYGSPPTDAKNWREKMLAEVTVDPKRVVFLGYVPYDRYLKIIQLSTVHLYLTYPFVLSWSMIEAMAAGCVIVGSKTKPVEEVITHGENGLLVDFFKPEAIAKQVSAVLDKPANYEALSKAARRTVLRKYDLAHCMKQQLHLIQTVARRRG